MLKYVDTKVVFAEIPNEITLAINISGCPIKCPDCHSKYLWENIGNPLTRDSLDFLIKKNKGITCVSFMGGDTDPVYIKHLAAFVKNNYPNIKVAWYSGRDVIPEYVMWNPQYFDFIKVGPFKKELGGLDSKTTNQKLYKVTKKSDNTFNFDDVTYLFWK